MKPLPLYRNELPQLSGDLFLTDGGIETTLIFHEGIDLPEFASFVLLESEEGCGLREEDVFIDVACDILAELAWRSWGL